MFCKLLLVALQLEAALWDQSSASAEGVRFLFMLFLPAVVHQGVCTAVTWSLHSSGGLEVRTVVDPSDRYVLAPDSQERPCKERALLMFSCTKKTTFALKRADVTVDGRESCRDGCHRETRHTGFVFPLP